MNQIININDHREIEAAALFPQSEEIFFPVGTRPLAMVGQHGHQQIDSHKAVIRMVDDTPTCLGVVGKDYKVIPHGDYFPLVEQSLVSKMQASHLEGAVVHDKTSAFGAWARRDYIFPAVSATVDTPGIKDKMGYACFAWNSYDGSSSVSATLGTLAFYCTNGQFRMDTDARMWKRHTSGLNIEVFERLLETGIEKFYQEIEQYQEWAGLEVQDDKVEELFKAKFSPRRSERLFQQYEEEVATRGRNVWAVWNTLTAFAVAVSPLDMASV